MPNTFARSLRQNLTDAERILWSRLRPLKQIGLHFRRQLPFDPYVADFCCHAAKLIIELDGEHHGGDRATAYDARRTAYLMSRGYTVLRFANDEVARELDRVVETILRAAPTSTAPHPTSAALRVSDVDLPARGVISLTQQNEAGKNKRQAVAEITPQMVEAGVSEMLSFGTDEDIAHTSYDEIVRAVYVAMRRAEVSVPSPVS